jgi:hypothetical protein
MCRYLLEFKQSKEIRCANVCAFTKEVILCANQAFFKGFKLFDFNKAEKKFILM